ncbi:nucleoid-associated protein [Shewanella seohaensis]|uniref:nucleoid-associated protein n=1 Tax=Shewanella seohaensis TaxID=755175 RepID=UPI00200BF543|nr:nucleoid-associated protein [Shewanella seohaensis]MCL1121188.1 nucleoid-associated protein [Shewanella seohaensis]
MGINKFIVHQVVRDDKTNLIRLNRREEVNNIEGLTADVTDKLVKLFNDSSLSSGCFTNDNNDDPDALLPRFAELLKDDFVNNEFTDFVGLTRTLAKLFADEHLEKAKNAAGGYLVFYHAERGESHFLSVVLLRMAVGMTLSKDLEFNENERLDLEHLHLAARINITDWLAGLHSRYLAFKVGRTASEMRDYFSDFIGCKEFTEEREDTRLFIDAVNQCCVTLGYDETKTSQIRELAYTAALEKKKLGQPVCLEHMNAHLFPEHPQKLVQIAQDDPYNLNDQFSVDTRELRGFVRFKGVTKQLSISFDQALLGNVIVFEPEAKSLTINSIPPKLLAQLEKKDPLIDE